MRQSARAARRNQHFSRPIDHTARPHEGPWLGLASLSIIWLTFVRRGHTVFSTEPLTLEAGPKPKTPGETMSTDAASQHLKVSTAFGVIADSIPDWAAPSPVDAWTARDVVDHLLSWLPPLLQEATGIHLESPLDGPDPARQWRHRSAHIQAILENTSTASTAITAPRFAGMTVEVFIDRPVQQRRLHAHLGPRQSQRTDPRHGSRGRARTSRRPKQHGPRHAPCWRPVRSRAAHCQR